eukprot:scaffold8104_cov47-Cyclotella_meneghiniana.AAC.1
MWGGRSILPQVEMIVYPSSNMVGEVLSHWDDAEKLERYVWPIVRQNNDEAGEHIGSVYLPVLKGELREREKNV